MTQSRQKDVSSFLQQDNPDPHDDRVVSSTVHRTYRGQPLWQRQSGKYQHVSSEEHGIAEEVANEDKHDFEVRGLGLSNIPKCATSSAIRRVPVGSKNSPQPLSQATTARNTEEIDSGNSRWETPTPESSASFVGDDSYRHIPSNINLISSKEHGHETDAHCQSDEDLLRKDWSWPTWIIVILAVYSTLFSIVCFAIAIHRPRWGHWIGIRGAISYNTATFLSAFISKTIELSFVTTCVVALGQHLSRRAVARDNHRGGISIAEMNMRLWLMQPGALITHLAGVKHVIQTVLGVTVLLAAIAATFYTTAAEALVAPKLKFGRNETRTLNGQVHAAYANSIWLKDHCETPITDTMDPANRGDTCLQLDYAGNGFRSIGSWRNAWAERQKLRLNDIDGRYSPRPPPVSILYENTTVTGQWIGDLYEDIERQSEEHNRLFQNITMVMPHANVYHAARDPTNRVLQPDDLHGSGEYYLKAAVPAPALTVLCIGADDWEIELLVGNGSQYPKQWPVKTPFDDWFHWVQEDPTKVGGQWAPWFSKLPIDYNSVVNASKPWGSEWIYMLGKADQAVVGSTNNYTLCGIRSYQYLECSTSLWETKSGGQLSVHCGDDKEVWKKYSATRNATLPPPGGNSPTSIDSKNWKDIGTEWINSMYLNTGISDGNASIARFLTLSIPSYSNDTGAKLSPNFPSIAEGIGLLASHTLLMASDVAPFIHYWPWSSELAPILDPPQVQAFEGILSYKDYSSGYDQRWKCMFYIILLIIPVLNLLCTGTLLFYFSRSGIATDYTEPQNLFALAMNSPKSQLLAGSCGAGPSGEQLRKKWCVERRPPISDSLNHIENSLQIPYPQRPGPQHPHFYVSYPEEEPLLHTETPNTVASMPGCKAQGESLLSKLASPVKRNRNKWSSLQANRWGSPLPILLGSKDDKREDIEL